MLRVESPQVHTVHQLQRPRSSKYPKLCKKKARGENFGTKLKSELSPMKSSPYEIPCTPCV